MEQVNTTEIDVSDKVALNSANGNARRSVSKVTKKGGFKQTKEGIACFFSKRPGAFEKAVQECEKKAVNEDLDGAIIESWLLTEIDHWNYEKEKIVLLTVNSLIICKYDFISLRLLDSKRLMLHNVKIMAIGDLVYPDKAVLPNRPHGGIRIIYGNEGDLTASEQWNPFSTSIPYFTFIHHPIIYCEQEADNPIYNVDDFYQAMVDQTNDVYRRKNPGNQLQIFEGNILIESYANALAVVFNQSMIGFSKERGGVSF